jgi:hypothetical protein
MRLQFTKFFGGWLVWSDPPLRPSPVRDFLRRCGWFPGHLLRALACVFLGHRGGLQIEYCDDAMRVELKQCDRCHYSWREVEAKKREGEG